MLANDPKPDMIGKILDAVRSSVNLPVSIDTLDPSEIEAAVSAGVDLVLSVDAGNMEEVAPYVRDVPVVVLPSNMSEGVLPRGAEERFAAMFNNMLQAHELGIMRVIADLVLEPALKPGLLESLKAYQLFRQADENTPVLGDGDGLQDDVPGGEEGRAAQGPGSRPTVAQGEEVGGEAL
jgi:dihydropteroate synthase